MKCIFLIQTFLTKNFLLGVGGFVFLPEDPKRTFRHISIRLFQALQMRFSTTLKICQPPPPLQAFKRNFNRIFLLLNPRLLTIWIARVFVKLSSAAKAALRTTLEVCLHVWVHQLFCHLLTKSSGNPYLKKCDLAQYSFADAHMKKKQFTPFSQHFWDTQYKIIFFLYSKQSWVSKEGNKGVWNSFLKEFLDSGLKIWDTQYKIIFCFHKKNLVTNPS